MVCLGLTLQADTQVELQLKFYLAFKDAAERQDSHWIILDSAATTKLDTVLVKIVLH